jgi:hypothetical protein
MVRRYGDPVEVKAEAARGGAGADVPASFLWRGRLYVVRSVLGHWRERRAWWNEPAAQALHGEGSASSPDTACSTVDAPDAVDSPDAVDPPDAAGFAAEREVWRVEASAGRHVGVGVYDLCRGPVSCWSLLRVAD